MKQLKKTLLTLVALLAVTTGAWAQPEITTIPNGDFETWTYDGEDMPNNWNSNATSDGSLNGIMGGKQLKRSTDVRPGSSGQYSCSIWSKSVMGVTNIGILTSGRIHFGAASSTSNANYIYSDRDGSNTKNNVTNPCAMPFTGKPTAVKVWVKYVQGGTGYGQYATAKFSATIHGDADYVAYNLAEDDNDDNKALVVASAEQEIAYNNGEWEQLTIPFNYTDNNVVPAYILINAYTNAYPGKGRANDYLYIDDIELEYASASSGPEVAWTAASKTGTFTMPGGNVTLQPEYYPQAALAAAPTAINNVPATTDGAIVEAGTVANIGETTTAQGTVMYYVSQTALDDAALLALAADQWTADVPTAESLAKGEYYVYYYVRGNDSDTDEENFSDGDILAANALTVTIAAEPTYAVTFADGVNPEPPAEPEWTASPAADVKKGQTVTVTYSGERKVMGVKAEKKAKSNIVDLSTYSGGSYEVTEDVTFTGTTNNEIAILYKGEGYEVTLDNVNAPKCFIAAQDDNYNINVKLKGTSRLMGIYTQNACIIIGEAAAGGTVILVDEDIPLGASGTTITINGGTVKAKSSSYSALDSSLEVNGGAVYLEAGEGNAAVSAFASSSVTLYGWNGSAWETYSQDQRYLSTDNSKAPSQWTW